MKREDFKEVLGFEDILKVLEEGVCRGKFCEACPFNSTNNALNNKDCIENGYVDGDVPPAEFDSWLVNSVEEFRYLVKIAEEEEEEAW